MTSRNRLILEIATVSLMVMTAALHFLTDAHRMVWWFITFLQLALPFMILLLSWSFRRDMRAHREGRLVVASTGLATEVMLALLTMFTWMALATYAGLRGLPVAGQQVWVVLGLFALWLAWFVSAMRRARGYAFSFAPDPQQMNS